MMNFVVWCGIWFVVRVLILVVMCGRSVLVVIGSVGLCWVRLGICGCLCFCLWNVIVRILMYVNCLFLESLLWMLVDILIVILWCWLFWKSGWRCVMVKSWFKCDVMEVIYSVVFGFYCVWLIDKKMMWEYDDFCIEVVL